MMTPSSSTSTCCQWRIKSREVVECKDAHLEVTIPSGFCLILGEACILQIVFTFCSNCTCHTLMGITCNMNMNNFYFPSNNSWMKYQNLHIQSWVCSRRSYGHPSPPQSPRPPSRTGQMFHWLCSSHQAALLGPVSPFIFQISPWALLLQWQWGGWWWRMFTVYTATHSTCTQPYHHSLHCPCGVEIEWIIKMKDIFEEMKNKHFDSQLYWQSMKDM